MLFYLPNFLNVNNFLSLFTRIDSLIASILLPIVIIAAYLLHILFVGLITKWHWSITEKRSPSKSGIIPRNIPSKIQNFYHIRSFMIKYPKNAVSRGPFPWLIRWLYNFVGCNSIGKGSVIEESVAGDRFVDIGKNCYFGVNGAISSHAVEGIFGNISFFKVNIGDNVAASAFNCIGPGVEVGNNAGILPMSGATKFNKLKGDDYYLGTPLRRIFKKKIQKYIQVSEADLKRAEDLWVGNESQEEGKKNE
jgi:acetyltransferase-like isoleucine patch superfamily enzyme